MSSTFLSRVNSRRSFLRGCAASLLVPGLGRLPGSAVQSVSGVLSLDHGWLFGGKWTDAAAMPGFNDSSFAPVTLPHSVVPLSWRNWHPVDWQSIWSYRRHLSLPEHFHGQRIFLHFDRVMAAANVTVNGHELPPHLGGFLPFQYEVTDLLHGGDNVISVAVDARWLNVPPSGSPRGPAAVDYLLPGGIIGSVTLHAMPQIFIRDAIARPVNVLSPKRQLDIICQLDSGRPPVRFVSIARDHARWRTRCRANIAEHPRC